MNVTVLTYLEREEDPASYDVVVDQVIEALRQGGHQAAAFGVHGDVAKLVAGLSERRPDLVFNLLETFGEDTSGDVAVAGLLDLMKLRYTGSGPGELFLNQDKALA
jgi:D-alanine-D-alanine ligase